MYWNSPNGTDPRKNTHNDWNDGGDPLEELFRKLFSGWRGRGGGQGADGGNGGHGFGGHAKRIIPLVLAALVLVWLGFGFFKIEDAERGVVTRFGAFHKEATQGLNWHLPYPIDRVEIVNVGVVRNIEIGFRANQGKVLSESLMLTKDENIIDVQISVQYRVQDARHYLFNVRNPEQTLQQMVESALRQVVGLNEMDFVLTSGREEVAIRVQDLVQTALDNYETGLLITNVNMQNAQAPEQVQAAFDDAVKAREDKERFINEAEAYANQVLPQARGASARALEEARAYRDEVIAKAEGETDRFDYVYEQYQAAPDVTANRLYIETMEQVLGATNKLILDVEGSNNLLYLPLDQLRGKAGVSLPSTAVDTIAPVRRTLDTLRNRRVR